VDHPKCPDSADASCEAGVPRTDKRTVVYARQSRTRISDLSSCQAQVDMCRDVASQRSLDVSQVFSDEGQSSEKLDRPALKQLIAAVKAGQVNRLIVYSIDRLTRRLVHLHTLLELFEAYEVELVVVTDPNYSNSAVSRLMTNIVAAASEFQQDLTRERMADMRAALKRQGKRVAGRVPFGYQADPNTKKLLVDPEPAIIVRDFFELASKGARPSELANLANLSDWNDQNGESGKWTARRILKLLQNTTYLGKIYGPHSTLPGEHEAVVNAAIFDAVQNELSARKTRGENSGKQTRRKNPHQANLLGLLVCGQCNRPMTTSVSHRGTIRYISYRCRSNAGGRPPCPGAGIGQYNLERFVCDVLADVEDEESEIPLAFRKRWTDLDERLQQRRLPDVIERVVFNHDSGEVTIETIDELSEVFEIDSRQTDQPPRSR
jgi:site-specific DNA recombinase